MFDEYIGLMINNSSVCVLMGVLVVLLVIDVSIFSVLGICDGKWSGVG